MTAEMVKEYQQQYQEYSTKDWEIVERVLNNTYKYATADTAITINTTTETVNVYLNMTNKLIKRLLVFRDILSIQPMQGPVAQIFMLGYKEKNNKMVIEVSSTAIAAKTRKVVEPLHMGNKTLLELSEEEINHFVNKAYDEYCEELINELKNNASRTFQVRDVDSLTQRISEEMKYICRKSGRSNGNFLVLSRSSMQRFFPDYSDYITSNFYKTSVMIEGLQLYISDIMGNDLLIGYNNTVGSLDGPIIFAPYVLCMTSGIIISNEHDKDDLSAIMLTRYGIWTSEERVSKYCTVFSLAENNTGDVNE